jgi:multiple sugar transport system permease protein
VVTPTVANSLFISTSSTLLTLVFALCGAYFFARLPHAAVHLPVERHPAAHDDAGHRQPGPAVHPAARHEPAQHPAGPDHRGRVGRPDLRHLHLRKFVSDIPQDLFEAAEIDGANHFQQMRNVVLPLSGPILGTVGVMHFIGSWNDFVLPLIVMRDHSRLPVMVQLIRMAGEYIKLWGPLMAGYAIASIPIIMLFVLSMKLFIKGLTEGAVKG